jgi:heptosyltransferase III
VGYLIYHERMKCAVLSCLGLGDGLLAMILSYNLKRNGYSVTTFHPHLNQLQSWFPDQTISPFPQRIELSSFDKFFIFYEKSRHMKEILQDCLEHARERTTVINPIATPNRDYPFWAESQFDGSESFANNLVMFCKTVLHLKDVVKSNGIVPQILVRQFARRVILHPTSSKAEKNWKKEKYLLLAQQLKEKNWEPVFILSPDERKQWPEVNAHLFPTLEPLAAYVAQSGSFIGNDSGIGHLASCLGLPTVTLCSTKRTANFWRPHFSKGTILIPSSYVPNIKGFRLRDRYWRELISVPRVLRAFEALTNV